MTLGGLENPLKQPKFKAKNLISPLYDVLRKKQ